MSRVCVLLAGPSNSLEDEGNLLYVAVTRAKKRLILTSTLVRLLSCAGVSLEIMLETVSTPPPEAPLHVHHSLQMCINKT